MNTTFLIITEIWGSFWDMFTTHQKVWNIGICGKPVRLHPDSKVHGANMGPTWVLSAPDGPHVGPMNLAIRVVICEKVNIMDADGLIMKYLAGTMFTYNNLVYIQNGCTKSNTCHNHHLWYQIGGLVQERYNSSALAMELHLSCTNPSTNEM